MGLDGAQVNGVLPLGNGKYYRRMDAELPDDGLPGSEGDEGRRRDNGASHRRSETRKYVLACAVFASLNSVLLGYDVGVMSGAIIFIHEDLNVTEVQQEILVGCLSVISLIGSLAAGRISDAIGRKWTMAFAALLFQTGALIMTCAPSFTFLIGGRLLAGVGIGFGIMIAPVYIAEISPSAARGSLTSFPEIFINFGILLGYVSNYAFSGLSKHISWRIMLGVGILPSVFIGFALFVIPESPRWLVMWNRVEDARSVLSKLCESAEEVEQRLVEIKEAAENANPEKGTAVWKEILRPTLALRRMLITGIGIHCFQQISGIDALVYYSPTILKDAGITSNNFLLGATVAVGFCKTSFILVAIFLIDKVGRKPLLYISTTGMTLCLFVLSLALFLLRHEMGSQQFGIRVLILTMCGDVAFFSVGIGPICWVLNSEIYPLRLRAQASSVGAVGNRLSSGLLAMCFLSMAHAITVEGIFLLFSLIAALSVIFVHKYVPETKGKTLEQIELLYQNETEWQRVEVELGDCENLVDKDKTFSPDGQWKP